MSNEQEFILIEQAENLLLDTNEARDIFEGFLGQAQEAYQVLQQFLREGERIREEAERVGGYEGTFLEDLLDEIEEGDTKIDLRYAFSN